LRHERRPRQCQILDRQQVDDLARGARKQERGMSNYDRWKCTDPRDYEDDDTSDGYCDHGDAEYDIMMGEASCSRCGAKWWLTNEEIAAECQRIAEYQEAMEREERWARWYRLTAWMRGLIPVAWRLRRSRKISKLLISDDEIPF
jgi:hypothetical protein